jgi:1-acyl-sn-glycerol-3-phosphate acyltransferase
MAASTWQRRAISIPLVLVMTGLVWFVLLPLLLLAGFTDLVLRRRAWTSVRLALFAPLYLAIETAGLFSLGFIFIATLGHLERRHRLTYAVQRWYTGTLFRMICRLFEITTQVEGGDLAATGPAIFLVNHASIIDVLVPGVFVSGPHHMQLRYVLKRELLWVPCLDIAGHFIPNYFASRKSADTAQALERIRQLKADLGPKDGVILYPEGTRFSKSKRDKLLTQGSATEQNLARELSHLLPIKPGGIGTLLQQSPRCDVVIVGHRGLKNLTNLTDIWRGHLVHQHVSVKCWRFSHTQIPAEPHAQLDWINEQWKQLDRWLSQEQT